MIFFNIQWNGQYIISQLNKGVVRLCDKLWGGMQHTCYKTILLWFNQQHHYTISQYLLLTNFFVDKYTVMVFLTSSGTANIKSPNWTKVWSDWMISCGVVCCIAVTKVFCYGVISYIDILFLGLYFFPNFSQWIFSDDIFSIQWNSWLVTQFHQGVVRLGDLFWDLVCWTTVQVHSLGNDTNHYALSITALGITLSTTTLKIIHSA